MSKRGVIVGVDVGGTFTDLFLLDAASGTLPHRQGAVAARRRGAGLPQRPRRARRRRGDRTRSCTAPPSAPTRCWSGAGRRSASSPRAAFATCWKCAGATAAAPGACGATSSPIADRDMRVEVDERTLADGRSAPRSIAAEVRAAAQAARCDKGAQSVAIIFINAYANAENERARARRRARGLAERLTSPPRTRCCPKSASSSAPRPRRSTPICSRSSPPTSASSKPRSRRRSFPASCTSCSRTAASCRPRPRASCRCAPRCPARPPAWSRARRIAKAAGFDNLITCDLGGTSFDVSVIAGGKVVGRGADHDRFRPGHPHADDRDHHHRRGRRLDRLGRSRRPAAGRAGKRRLGAGAGLLRPGQHAADADRRPGRARPHQCRAPARRRAEIARRRGGASAPSRRMSARRSASTPTTAAAAIVRVADARMAGAIRLVSIERGHDPARFVAMPFGGGGALHVGALIREIGLKCALVPRFPGITSALGCVLADLRHDMVQTVNLMLDGLDAAALERAHARRPARRRAPSSRPPAFAVERIDVLYELDMHYLGQTHTVPVPLPVSQGDSARRLREHGARRVRGGLSRRRSAACCPALRCASCRCASRRSAGGRRSISRCSRPMPSASLDKARRGSRQVWFDGGWRDTARLVAARSAGGRNDRRAGDPGAARRHHRDRAGPSPAASTRSAI